MQSYPIDLLKKMLETYSPSGSEGELADFLRDEMVSHGFKVRRDRVGNAIGEMGSDGPRILLCGHMDTVPGDIPVRIEGDLLYGRGAVDAKSSLAAMIMGTILAEERKAAPFHVTIAGGVEEEASSAGAKAIIEDNPSYDFAVFGEPSGASNIIIGYKGSVHLQVTCLTATGHSASPWVSRSSFEEICKFWRLLQESLVQNNSASKFSAVTGCVTAASAGGQKNIPAKATLEIDLRIPPNLKAADLASKIRKLAEEYQNQNQGVKVEAKAESDCEAYLANEDSNAVRLFRWAIRKTIGGQVLLIKKTGTSDMNLFAQSVKFPMIAYGPGVSSLDHTENEHISLKEYLSSIEVYANAILRSASPTRNAPLPSTGSVKP